MCMSVVEERKGARKNHRESGIYYALHSLEQGVLQHGKQIRGELMGGRLDVSFHRQDKAKAFLLLGKGTNNAKTPRLQSARVLPNLWADHVYGEGTIYSIQEFRPWHTTYTYRLSTQKKSHHINLHALTIIHLASGKNFCIHAWCIENIQVPQKE